MRTSQVDCLFQAFPLVQPMHRLVRGNFHIRMQVISTGRLFVTHGHILHLLLKVQLMDFYMLMALKFR